MIKKEFQDISIDDYDYDLPDDRIAKFPLDQRDKSKLLLYKDGKISETIFSQITSCLPENSLFVFNNTRVIHARLLFRKATGAQIEIFCLEPAEPRDYTLIFQQTKHCRWTCLVGNLKKWKEGVLLKTIYIENKEVVLRAKRIQSFGDTHLVEFIWDSECTFAELLDAAGILPIPPYLHRETESNDLKTYQTVYSKIKGSVAAPTAGLHFTPELLSELDAKGFGREEVTLHVGAGTFRPVKSEKIGEHEMHTEYISVTRHAIASIKKHLHKIIAVGTTSVRTLESLYQIGSLLQNNPEIPYKELVVEQWVPYGNEKNELSAEDAIQNILDYLDRNNLDTLITTTQIIIVPGYEFKIVKGIITNFHQPRSTLLLLVSAFVKENWKSIYDYALTHDFRFLSYGDSSLLF